MTRVDFRVDMLVVPSGAKSQAESKIDHLATRQWRKRIVVCEMPAAGLNRQNLTDWIIKTARKLRVEKILLCHGTACEHGQFARQQIHFKPLDATFRSLFGEDQADLKRLLCDYSLDHESSLVLSISNWMHAEKGPDGGTTAAWVQPRVNDWRRQFYSVGGDLGLQTADTLLRILQIMPTSHVATCVIQHGVSQEYGYAKDVPGKSWGVVLNSVRNRGSSPCRIQPLHLAIGATAESGLPLRVVEDGLFSATELLGVLESLMNVRQDGATIKTPPLPEPELMYAAHQQWAYGCVTDYGEYFMQAAIRAWGFHNVGLHLSEQTQRIQVLAPEGIPQIESALKAICCVKESTREAAKSRAQQLISFRSQLNKHVVSAVRSAEHGSYQVSPEMESLLRQIGAQLWASYLTRKFGSLDSQRWPAARIAECSLGKDGLGLAFAFAHSVPKASLPVFWASGEVVDSAGKKFDWIPLLPNAEN